MNDHSESRFSEEMKKPCRSVPASSMQRILIWWISILDVPVKKVVCKGAGAAVLKDVPAMVRLTRAVIKSTRLPVTVKTRLGWDDDSKNIEEVAERLQDEGIGALTIHGRTRSQLYKGDADWTLIARVKNNPRIRIPVFGNGDVDSPEKALEYKNRYGVDGIMIGRAAIGYPWIFQEIKHFLKTGEHLQIHLPWKNASK